MPYNTLGSLHGNQLMARWEITMGQQQRPVLKAAAPPLDAGTIMVIIISIILFLVYLYFYLGPVIRDPDIVSAYSQKRRIASEAQKQKNTLNGGYNNKSLVDWMRRGSKGRFVGTEGDPCCCSPIKDKSNLRRLTFFKPSLSRLFARSSVIPPPLQSLGSLEKTLVETPKRESKVYKGSTVTPPPPAYVSRQNSPAPEYSENKSPGNFGITRSQLRACPTNIFSPKQKSVFGQLPCSPTGSDDEHSPESLRSRTVPPEPSTPTRVYTTSNNRAHELVPAPRTRLNNTGTDPHVNRVGADLGVDIHEVFNRFG